MASMRDWLKPIKKEDSDGRVVVVHCKAGKGRSGTVACSYLVSEEGWTVKDALGRFTERRMRVGFGNGISIPSQLRWIGYVERWSRYSKTYVEREIEVLEVHTWGLRDGVSVAIEGYVNEGRKIKTFHTFNKSERTPVNLPTTITPTKAVTSDNTAPPPPSAPSTPEEVAQSFIFRSSKPILLPTSDINLALERRNKASYGLNMLTSVAHVWFNCYFEGSGPERHPSTPLPSGVFTIDWEAMDGIKGSARKGTKALDKVSIVWRAKEDGVAGGGTRVIVEPAQGQEVPQSKAADWAQDEKSTNDLAEGLKEMGMKSDAASRASSTTRLANREGVVDEVEGVKAHHDNTHTDQETREDTPGEKANGMGQVGIDQTMGIINKMRPAEGRNSRSDSPKINDSACSLSDSLFRGTQRFS